MPSIREMFTADEAEGVDDRDFDLDKLLAETDRALAESTRLDVPGIEVEGGDLGPVAPEAEDPPIEAEPEESDTSEPDEEPGGETQATSTGGHTVDPLGLLPPERQAALLALDRVFQEDPAKRDAVYKTLSAVPEPPAEEMPEEIEPGSVAATLWHQNQATQRQINEIAASNRAQQEAFAKQQAATAAERAGANFEARYEGKLTHDDVLAVARTAGATGMAARFAAGSDDLANSFEQALEHVLWTTPEFRAKAIGSTQAAPVAPADQPESRSRKRKLTAVSSSASPVSGPAPAKTPLESRVDGRLTPGSRLSVVKEMASQLQRQNEGTF